MSDDSFGLEGMILSRKISGSSVGRHFVRWKKRMFRLNSSAAMLCILDNVHNKSASQGPPVSISLSSLSVELKEHYYTADKKCCLSLQYPHREELLMKFDCRYLILPMLFPALSSHTISIRSQTESSQARFRTMVRGHRDDHTMQQGPCSHPPQVGSHPLVGIPAGRVALAGRRKTLIPVAA